MSFFRELFKIQSNRKFQQNNDFSIMPFSNYKSTWIDINTLDDCLLVYQTVPTIQAIVNKKAKSSTNFQLREFDGEKELFDTPLLKVFANPHPLYSPFEFWQTISKQFDIFDEVYIWLNRANVGGLLSENDTMLVLPANQMTIKLKSGKSAFDEDIKTIEDVVEKYVLILDNKTISYRPDEIIHITKTGLKTTTLFTSDLTFKSIQDSINSILAAYNVRNSLWNRNGGFGVLYDDSKSAMGNDFVINKEMDSEEKRDLQSEFKKYGFSRDQWNIIIATRKLGYLPISFPLNDMDITDGVKQAKQDICDALDFPHLMLSILEGQTFTNKEQAQKELYSESIIPYWKLLEAVFNQHNLTKNRIVFDYAEAKALLKDYKLEMEGIQLNDNIQYRRYKRGLITMNEMREACGLPSIQGGDVYYEPQKNEQDEYSEN